MNLSTVKFSGIYCITNQVNGKHYIGQSTDISKRWQQHIQTAKTGDNMSLIHKAMREYGINNFFFEVLVYCPHYELTYWERFYVLALNTQTPYGYNVQIPSVENTPHHKNPYEVQPVVYEIMYYLLYTDLTFEQISKGLGVSNKKVIDVNRGKLLHLPEYIYPLRESIEQQQREKNGYYYKPKVKLTADDVCQILGNPSSNKLLKKKKASYADLVYWREYYGL